MPPTPSTPSPYPSEFLERQRERLEVEAERLADQIAGEQAGLREWHEGLEGVDQHPGDDAAATEGMEIDVALIENARAALAAVEDALKALERGHYGWDDETGRWIPSARLEALPWARRTIEGQRQIEERFDYDESGYKHDSDVRSI